MSKNTIAIDLKSMAVKDIKIKIETFEELPKEWEEAIQLDTRAGVQQLAAKWQRRKKKLLEEKDQFKVMCQFEDNLFRNGFQTLAGIDEVGRGPLAGPIVAAAVILPTNVDLVGINDSKQLSEKKRNAFYELIQKQALSIGVGLVEAPEIDKINIYEATKLAMKKALAQLNVTPQHLLIDAMKLNTGLPETSIIKGDSRSISIAAASIIAKVTRDRMMEDYHNFYPEYQFSKNMGYGTKEHLEAINTYGPTPLHRMSFAPLNQLKG